VLLIKINIIFIPYFYISFLTILFYKKYDLISFNDTLLYTDLISFSKFECSRLFLNKIFIFLNNSSIGLNSDDMDTFNKSIVKIVFLNYLDTFNSL
jgi:hypothetical protein